MSVVPVALRGIWLREGAQKETRVRITERACFVLDGDRPVERLRFVAGSEVVNRDCARACFVKGLETSWTRLFEVERLFEEEECIWILKDEGNLWKVFHPCDLAESAGTGP